MVEVLETTARRSLREPQGAKRFFFNLPKQGIISFVKQARRASEQRGQLTFAFCLGDRYALSYIKISYRLLFWIVLISITLLTFTIYITKNSGQIYRRMADYSAVRAENQLLNTKILLATDRQKSIKDQISALKAQETEIKELFYAAVNSGQKPHTMPSLITTHRIVTQRGEFGRVLVDNQIVIEYFDNSSQPMAFQRALATAAKLKELREPARKFRTRKIGSSVYAYINDQPVFVVLPEDITRLNEPQSANKLAKYWLNNIKTALSPQSKTLADRLPWLKKENRQNHQLYKALYPNINYPVYMAMLDSTLSGGQLQDAEHLLKLSRQELASSRRSFEELKGYVQSYKDRFEYTPSIFPVRNTYILSSFGWRHHPILNRPRFHSGIDLPSWYGAPIYATAAGTVRNVGWLTGYGYHIEIDHGYGFTTLYGHNSVNLVTAGQKVAKGQIIARVGSSGLSEGPHCHYEVRYYDRPTDPTRFLNLNIFTASHSF